MVGSRGDFSEEDLTRYLQLTLDLFQDMQSSLQPRLHLEFGLLKLVHAGQLQSIEEAISRLGADTPLRASAPAPRTGIAKPAPSGGRSQALRPEPANTGNSGSTDSDRTGAETRIAQTTPSVSRTQAILRPIYMPRSRSWG